MVGLTSCRNKNLSNLRRVGIATCTVLIEFENCILLASEGALSPQTDPSSLQWKKKIKIVLVKASKQETLEE